MLSCHLPGGNQIGRMSLPKFLFYVKWETFLFWCSVSFRNILQGPLAFPTVLLLMVFVNEGGMFSFLYLLWDLRGESRMGNRRGCSLEFPACCRVRLRACPVRHPPPARPLLSEVACVCTCMRGLDVWESL